MSDKENLMELQQKEEAQAISTTGQLLSGRWCRQFAVVTGVPLLPPDR